MNTLINFFIMIIYKLDTRRIVYYLYFIMSITPNIEVTFLENGHLIGAAMILIEINYSSDLLNKGKIINLDILIQTLQFYIFEVNRIKI